MASHFLCIREPGGGISPFTGNVGSITFVDGITVEPVDVDSWPVRRLLSERSGGLNLCPNMEIYEHPQPAAVAEPEPVPEPVDEDEPATEPPTVGRPRKNRR